MVQIDIPAAFAVGAFFADAARKQLRAGRPEYGDSVRLQDLLFRIVCFGWFPVSFFLNHFGWR